MQEEYNLFWQFLIEINFYCSHALTLLFVIFLMMPTFVLCTYRIIKLIKIIKILRNIYIWFDCKDLDNFNTTSTFSSHGLLQGNDFSTKICFLRKWTYYFNFNFEKLYGLFKTLHLCYIIAKMKTFPRTN